MMMIFCSDLIMYDNDLTALQFMSATAFIQKTCVANKIDAMQLVPKVLAFHCVEVLTTMSNVL